MKILFSPHDDDSHLFACFILMREKPVVCVVLDSYIQPNRGERGCSARERAAETAAACALTGSEYMRLGLRDDDVSYGQIVAALRFLEMRSVDDEGHVIEPRLPDIDTVYAPAVQGGNVHHDMVNRAAHQAFGDRVIEYTTYTKTELWTKGNIEVIPTPEEMELKERALACYKSQIRINHPHFKAVLGKSEWLNK